MLSSDSLLQHTINIKPNIKSSKKKSPSAVRNSKDRMTNFNKKIQTIKSLHGFYPELCFQLLKTKTKSNNPHIGWMKIDYGQFDYEPKKVIALMKANYSPFKIDDRLNFFQNCQKFQNMWNWSATNCDGKRIMSEVVNHLNRDMKDNEHFCGDCSFNPNCFFIYSQLSKDKG